MEFFGVGPFELLVILVITLLVVGPKRLPEMAANLARTLRTLRMYANRISSEFNETMHDLEQEYDSMKGEWKDVGQGLEQSVRPASDALQSADSDARKALEGASTAANEPPEPAPRR